MAIPVVHGQNVNPFKQHLLLPRFGQLPVVTRTNQGIAQYKHATLYNSVCTC
ncbi:hypothetical protein ACPV3O_05345 [Vibrio rotiferianus]